MNWQDRAHFFAVAAQQMRRLLVDYARAGLAEKRGGGRVQLSLTEVKGLATPSEQSPLDLDDALRRLETLDPRAARIVELRYFGGATEQETAEAVHVSVATVKRDWDFARIWLIQPLETGKLGPVNTVSLPSTTVTALVGQALSLGRTPRPAWTFPTALPMRS